MWSWAAGQTVEADRAPWCWFDVCLGAGLSVPGSFRAESECVAQGTL